MEIEEYVARREKHLEVGAARIRDFRVFDFNYIPEKPLMSVEQREEPFSYPYFYSNLSYLQSVGLVLLVSTKVGRSYTNRIQLLFDREVFEAAWRGRFG